jgi:acyl-phosphate glycerol 3-phosphate acyltransferase
METFIVISYAYLLGSIPFGFILTKIFIKKDIRKSGSGNIGASNVLRSGGKFLGLLTLLLDGAKGYFAILITLNNFQDYLILSASLTFMGHLFPIWLKFKGGKGVATYLGILFAINFILAIVFILTWIIIILISKYPSLASLVSTFIVLIVNFIFNGMYQSFILILFFLLILYSHKSNIQRLKAGTENKINL